MTKQINGRSGSAVAADHEPGSDLTATQRKAASELLAKRPHCVPGTRAIILEREAKSWHDEVTAEILRLKLKPEQVTAFCDACGVAD